MALASSLVLGVPAYAQRAAGADCDSYLASGIVEAQANQTYGGFSSQAVQKKWQIACAHNARNAICKALNTVQNPVDYSKEDCGHIASLPEYMNALSILGKAK